MALYLIGLGLGDERDVTVKGVEAIRASDAVYLESYTSILGVPKEKLEAAWGKPIQVAFRETVESEAECMINSVKEGKTVSLLVVGDPFGATTHTDLVLRAFEAGIKVHVIHNASIMNAAGACGLQLYNFGQTISIPFFTSEWRPDSFYNRIAYNAKGGMHTLCLLDIKVREPNFEVMMRTGKTVYNPPRYMTVNEAVSQLLEVEEKRGEGVCGPEALGIGLARVGQDTQCIVSGPLKDLLHVDFGGPLHSLVLVGGTLHDLELAFFNHLRWDGEHPRRLPEGGAEEEEIDNDREPDFYGRA